MAVTLPAFTPLEESLFLTLYARALDNRTPHLILAAAMADELVHKSGALDPGRPNAHVIGADVTEEDWLDAVPTGRPAVIAADGLMGFLTQDEPVSLWNPAHRPLPQRRVSPHSSSTLFPHERNPCALPRKRLAVVLGHVAEAFANFVVHGLSAPAHLTRIGR
jgi:hypothetical protein